MGIAFEITDGGYDDDNKHENYSVMGLARGKMASELLPKIFFSRHSTCDIRAF